MFIIVTVVISATGTYFGAPVLYLVPVAVGIALIGVWGSYWTSDKLVLAMTHAKVIKPEDAPQLYNIVDEIRIASGLPMPKIAIVTDPAPNAFATGRDPEHAVIAFTTGLLEIMDRDQLQGVTAHELAHVKNRDTLVMAVVATTAGLIAIIADMALRASLFGKNDNGNPIAAIISIAALLLAPIAAVLIKASVSRKREALADSTAVAFTRNPTGLRRALETLAADSTVVQTKSQAVAHVWIESPLEGKSGKLFDTHPPIAERIATLAAMESQHPGN